MKNLNSASFPDQTVSNIATYFLQQKLAYILDEEKAIGSLENTVSTNSLSVHARSSVDAICVIAERQSQRLGQIARLLEISLQRNHTVLMQPKGNEYLRAVNEDTLYGEIMSAYSRQQSKLVYHYEEALNFAQTMGNFAAEELLVEAIKDAKKSDLIFKRAGLRLVMNHGNELFMQRAVMT